MGVPKFYRWISERYPCLSEVVKEFQIPEFDNLYLDMNGIIHVCSHPEDDNPHFRITEEKIFEDIMYYLEFLFRMIKPRKAFVMAVDGVAPRAKMNQQRGRRFRSAREALELEKKAKEKGETLPTEKRFDSNCITPGTPFMVRLQEQLKYFVVKKVSTDPLWRGVQVYLSGHETPGEGEHKIMDFIRQQRSSPDYDPNTRHCLYGLDADLMMLGLATHEPHFSLLREEVRFGGRKNQSKRPATPEETTFHLLHLSLFREYLDFEFSELKETLPFPYDLESVIDDWVMMGFLVGNDFIPHLPNLHINHDALPLLWRTYIEVLPSCGGYINNGGHLSLERFEKYLTLLSKFDIDTFSEQYGDLKWLEGKTADKSAERAELMSAAKKLRKNQTKSNNKFSGLEKFDFSDDEDVGMELMASPDDDKGEVIALSDEDSDDTFEDEFRHHKRHYYMTKMEYEKVTPDVLRDQAEGYVRGIQWILLYYYEGVPSWSWFYPHHYAPYMSDVKDFKDMELEFELGTAFLPFQQLMAVLPAASKDLLPPAYQSLMLTDSSPVIDFYPPEFNTDLNGKQQDWEAVVLIPFIEEERLLIAMKSREHLLTPDEVSRNKHGPCLMYQYSPDPAEPYLSPIPHAFPDIAVNHSALTKIELDELRVDSRLMKKGLLDGVRLDVYFPGFPTLKHIPHRSELKKEGVKVFQQNSRGFNVMLHIKEQDEPDTEITAKEYLGREIYAHWPHLYQAKVVSVSDGEFSYSLVEAPSTKGGKSSKVSPRSQMKREEMDDNACNIWRREVSSIKEKYKDRLGVVVGHTDILLKALPMTGRKYVLGTHGRITTEKQFGSIPMPFVLQATVKDITVHDPGICQFNTLEEYLPVSCPVFMLGWPHYGCQGEVLEVDVGNGRVRINVSTFEEPNLYKIISDQMQYHERYVPGYILAQRVGISGSLVSRLTGTIYMSPGTADSGSEKKVNIGLNLKFTKRGEEVPGYTKMQDGQWTYSQKTIEIVQQYVEKFPEVWDYISRSDRSHNDMYYEKEIIPEDSDYSLQSIQEYIKSLPCQGIRSIKCNADIIASDVIKALEEEARRVVEINKKKQGRVRLQVKPHLLYRPLPTHGALIPDATTTYELFDRIVNVRQGYAVPFGLRGTVVGIHPAENETNTMYEVIFDEDFQGGISIRSSTNRGYRMPPSGMLNLTHGERKNGVQTRPQRKQASFSKAEQGRQYRNVASDHSYADSSRGRNNQYSNNQFVGHDNRTGYSGDSRNSRTTDNRGGSYSNMKAAYDSGYDSIRPGQQYWNRQPDRDQGQGQGQGQGSYDNKSWRDRDQRQGQGQGSYDNKSWRDRDQRQGQGHGSHDNRSWRDSEEKERQPGSRQKSENERDNKRTGKSSPRQGTLAGQVFNGDNKSQPQFVTPRVAHNVSTSRRVSQGEGQGQGNTNQEFEDMWKQLKTSAPSTGEDVNQSGQGTSLQEAAAALPKVPSPGVPHTSASQENSNNSGKTTKIDVQNLFSQASQAQTNDEFSAMFKSLEVSEQKSKSTGPVTEKLAIQSEEEGTALIKKMLHLDEPQSDNKQETDTTVPPTGATKSYGRQLSIQELFDGAKQQQRQPSPMDTITAEKVPQQEQKVAMQQLPQQPKQEANQRPHHQQQKTWQQLQQTALFHGGVAPPPAQQPGQQQKRPNALLTTPQLSGRNPVMELMQFTQQLQCPVPQYDYIVKAGNVYCVVTIMNVGRYQGVMCKNREEAAESAASVALLQMRSSMQMALHPMMRMRGFLPGMVPQARQFSSPNSAFSPVPHMPGQFPGGHFPVQNQMAFGAGNVMGGAVQPHGNRPQFHQPPSNQTGHQSANYQSGNPQGLARGGVQQVQNVTNQKATNKHETVASANQRTEGRQLQTSSAGQGRGSYTNLPTSKGTTPFVPLQVTRKQSRKESTSEESRNAEHTDRVNSSGVQVDSVHRSSSIVTGSETKKPLADDSHKHLDVKHTSPNQQVAKEDNITTPKKHSDSNTGATPSSSDKKSQAPGSGGKSRSRRRMAANLNFGNVS